MRSRDNFPPKGWKFTQPETAWHEPKNSSFNALVTALIRHRRGNPHLIEKHNWATDFEQVALEVEEFNAVRCRNNGWFEFIQQENAPSPKLFLSRFQARKPVAAAGGSIKRVAAGIGALYEWLGSGANPVGRGEAERRAAICATCPKNGKGDWTRFFTGPAVAMIRKQLDIKQDLKLETPYDEVLGVCEACTCELKLKCWVPMEFILSYTTEETKAKLHPDCWILAEAK